MAPAQQSGPGRTARRALPVPRAVDTRAAVGGHAGRGRAAPPGPAAASISDCFSAAAWASGPLPAA
ncbi:hypothetical protein ABT160_36450, partial [Streptomyces sp. NPDC001941]|uniref:hypothetical protein n=1 Tax=Streptomyces sp. NPDC001941 TaxID=3154659 RepID=UPI0033330198